VQSDEPGRASVDLGEVGNTPVDVPSLSPGLHKVRVEFANGATAKQTILVQPGQLSQVYLRNTTQHDGVHFAIGFGPMFDVRLMGILSVGYALDPEDVWYQLGVLGAVRLNLGSMYSMELGLRFGMPNSDSNYDDFYDEYNIGSEFEGGLQLSLLSLRLGSRRIHLPVIACEKAKTRTRSVRARVSAELCLLVTRALVTAHRCRHRDCQ
jgi:hypothetical protein